MCTILSLGTEIKPTLFLAKVMIHRELCVQVYSQLADENNELPWEEGRLSAPDRRKLGMFRKPILKLLRRDPAQRTTAREFCNECCSLFTTNPLSTVVTTDETVYG